MFPYRDENITLRTPVITFALIAANVVVWLVAQGAGASPALEASTCNWGLIPGELTLQAPVGGGFLMSDTLACLTDPGRAPEHVFTSMFLHGSWMHLLGNMWFLWIFGNNVEDSMGRGRFLAFYVLCGVAAALAQVAADPSSIIPMVGASGAIGGVMGAYIVLYPRVRVFNLVWLGFLFFRVALPAWVMLGYWMLLQVLGGLGNSGGVAFWAHVGGFVAGALFIGLFSRRDYVQAHRGTRGRDRAESSGPRETYRRF